MTTHLVTFSDESMSRSADLCMASAKVNGVYSVGYWPHDRPSTHSRRAGTGLKQTSFYKQNEALLSQPRGLGFWAWKPYVIEKSMRSLSDGDILIYSDAGVEFINNVSHIIDRMDQDIFLFGNNWEHAHWCKRDVIEAIMPGTPWAKFGKQVQASVIFFRVSDYTRNFVKEWLDWCLVEWKCKDGFGDGRLIDDSPSWTPNHPEFREHRHDQAILTTMAYREGIKLHYWPATYNDGVFNYEKLPCYTGDDYPILFHHHRRRNHEWGEVVWLGGRTQ